jgi:hypothetical protein
VEGTWKGGGLNHLAFWVISSFECCWLWFVVRFELSRVGLLLVMHVSSSQDRGRMVCRSFCDSSAGRWTEKETDNMKIQTQLKTQKILYVFVNVRPDMLSIIYARRRDSCCNEVLL